MEPHGEQTFRLLASPGLVLGIAAGDLFRVNASLEPEVVARGGNLCIQVFRSAGVTEIEPITTPATERIGGWLDGRVAKELVYTIPVSAGFSAVESIFLDVARGFPDIEWHYGNVYDPIDGVTPLNWW